ncbi:hypothetical protein N1078_14320 [Pseudomonas sp. MIL19]|uniref:hypothetical protein n=1 Tax=Pseudomonas sp. MIL19 TaxID=2976979 RepID=UPI00236329D9|nr:hypothetical protein [Pseudomonas sp. MIL19]MDD2161755.1 hypothetical protein [Pseudomonas sp. MIL19]
MHESLENLCSELHDLAELVEKSWTDDRTLTEVYGWNCPSITRHDLAFIPTSIAKKIEDASPAEIEEALEETIDEIPNKILMLKTHTVPQLFSGNCTQAVPAYMATLSWIEQAISSIISWKELDDNKLLPPNISKRLRTIKAQLDQLTPDKDELTKQITLIKEATEAAESLPTDLQELIEARKKIEKLSDESIKLHGAIEKSSLQTEKHQKEILLRKDEAEKLVSQCEEAYRITTTKGLAAGFDQKASSLSNSMWVWVGGLVISLITGAILGTIRISSLTSALEAPSSRMEIVVIQAILSFLSIGAPLWFAWVSTKQIGQRFKLAEDYAFKASVAKAYEGYRREAARIDPSFEARLFSSALTRLEEAPLRFVDDENHGSPWQELISSKQFQSAMDIVPELKDKFINITKTSLESLTQDRRTSNKPTPED